jgi:hypothetical protein
MNLSFACSAMNLISMPEESVWMSQRRSLQRGGILRTRTERKDGGGHFLQNVPSVTSRYTEPTIPPRLSPGREKG